MDTKTIVDKIELLPENIQLQIADYIDFLTNKYLKSVISELNNDEEAELSEEVKKLLDKRNEHHEKNSWQVASTGSATCNS